MKRTELKAKTQLKQRSSLKSKTSLKSGGVQSGAKTKKLTVAQLKKRADKYYSIATRYRFAEKRGDTWYAECITCKVEKPIKQLQCGHFMSRRHNILRYRDENTAAQCLTEESNVHMYGDYNRSIADLIVGDVVIAFDEVTFKKTVATVLNIDSFVPDKLYKVTTEDGSTFYATGDHKVVANGKWVTVEDMLHDVSAYDILEL